jgi:hypothetical protein
VQGGEELGRVNYYDLCCRHHGRFVTIRDRFGRVYNGRIIRVSRTHVFLQPRGPRNLGGFGFGFWSPFGFFSPFAIPLAFIAGFALGGLFF